MNEFDYDVLQRKRIAQNARRKRGGSKSRKCTLPSDSLTPKQWRERNGEVMTYNLSKPMDWETFKSLPVDIQREYITKLCETHGGTQQRICKEMFHIGEKTLKAHFAEVGIKREFSSAREHSAVVKARKKAWERFIGPEPEAAEPEAEEAPPIEAEASPVPEHKPAMMFDSFTLNFSGPFDREALCNTLGTMLQNGQRVKLTITCEMEGD